jgi:hypothetical protein
MMLKGRPVQKLLTVSVHRDSIPNPYPVAIPVSQFGAVTPKLLCRGYRESDPLPAQPFVGSINTVDLKVKYTTRIQRRRCGLLKKQRKPAAILHGSHKALRDFTYQSRATL